MAYNEVNLFLMKKITLMALFLACSAPFCAAVPSSAPTAAPNPARPELAIIVVDSLPRRDPAWSDFNLIAEEFQRAFDVRHWPVDVTIERFAANNEPHALELKIFYQGIRSEFGGMEKRYRAWTVLTVNGTKHDFGVVEYVYMPRPGEPVDDMIHRIFYNAGTKTADLVAPFIVPTAPVH